MALLTLDPSASGAASPASLPGPNLTTIDLVGGIFCHICKLVFGNKKEFDSHYLTHDTTGTKEITYTCVACHFSSTSYPSFRGHCYTNHIIKDRFQCNNCNKSFSKLSALKEHHDYVHNFKCRKPNCYKWFPSKKELNVHQILHKEDAKPPYQCQTCSQEIENVATCEDHIDQHCIFTYACPFCTKNLTKENASEHLTKHFVDFGTPQIHSADFNDDSEIEEMPDDSSINIVGGILCCFCKKLFKSRVEVDTHFAEEHPDRDVLYTCIICNKQLEKYSLFGNHCYWHYSKNRFPCDSCDKTYPRLSLLVAHSEVHKYDKQPNLKNERTEARCRLCKLRLEGTAAAKRHLTVHRCAQFYCPVCARRYAEKYLLMRHIPQHFEAVLHMCKVCAKVFTAKNRLTQHAKTHTPAARTYECNLCGKGFLRSFTLSQHLNIHTGERPFTCPACPKKFASWPNCHKHMRRMHNIEPKMLNKSVIPNQVVAEKDKTEIIKVEEPKIPLKNQNMKETYVFCEDSNLEAISIDSTVKTEIISVEEPKIPPKIQNMKETYVFYENGDLEAISIDSTVKTEIIKVEEPKIQNMKETYVFYEDSDLEPISIDSTVKTEIIEVEEPKIPPKIQNMKETYVFYEDSNLEAISIDSTVVAREAESYESEWLS